MRGLKRTGKWIRAGELVASFTDAWIETVVAAVNTGTARVASFTDAWIETPAQLSSLDFNGRIFYRCVD